MTNLPHWWQGGVICQTYPKSSQDTTGSGTGDLRGVIQCLDYLYKLGVGAIWLTPFYVSPQVDSGCGVASYTAIDPAYGTLDDFDELATQAKPHGVHIILNMVSSHTSTQHAWLREVLNREGPYRQFYIQRDGEPETPPNNWCSELSGSTQRWRAESEQYYLYLFVPEQADLNQENPAVYTGLKKVCEFWVDHGVDGSRLDVMNPISKDPHFPENLDGDGRYFYTDEPRAYEFLHGVDRNVSTPRGLMTVGGMPSASLEHRRRYMTSIGSELSMTFNFHYLKADYPGNEKWTLAKPDFMVSKTLSRHWQ